MEDKYFKLGQALASSGLPLQYITSKGFLPKNHTESPEKVKTALEKFISVIDKQAQISPDLPNTAKDMLRTVHLLKSTLCYVVTISNADKETLNAGKVEVTLSTFNTGILESLRGTPLDDKEKKKVSKLSETIKDNFSAGKIPVIKINHNKGNTLTFPRKHPDFASNEYSVLPVSLVAGWVTKIRELMRDNLVIVNARKTEGQLREFILTADTSIVTQMYLMSDTLELFTNLGFKPTMVDTGNTGIQYVEGTGNLNMYYCEMGISEVDHPKRMLNLARIRDISLINKSNGLDAYIRRLSRYSNIDMEVTMMTVKSLVSEWSNERLSSFLNNVLDLLKSQLGVEYNSSIEVNSYLDFQFKFDKSIDTYSTAFMRAVVDYLYRNQVDFGGYTGSDKYSQGTVGKLLFENKDQPLAEVSEPAPVSVIDEDDLDF